MKLIDLFAGAGGLSCGLTKVGFRPLLANEINEVYANTYKLNHPNTHTVVGDIRKICELNLKETLGVSEGEIDLLAGGPPCQGFSINAPIRTLDDKRNHLFRDFLRIAKALKPKAILIENVPGIVSLGQGTVVKTIYKELIELGYSVSHCILFAGHYGVPQMRFRTVFIALKINNAKITFPEPEYDAKAVANFAGAKTLCMKTLPLFSKQLKKPTSVEDAISDLPPITGGERIEEYLYQIKPQSKYQSSSRNNSKAIYNHYCSKLGQINLERLKHIPQGGSWRDIPFELLPKGLQRARRSDHTKRYGRLHPKGLCSTILTKCDPHWGSFFHPYQDRVLSVREAARIQSFPDTFKFTGTITQQYEQVGNAVPPLLAHAVGQNIKKLLEHYFYGYSSQKRFG
ncbi:DNA cytosine methyltransferase [bacterium]|nr:DNA cytosine methyltransferase [bacterium]